MQFLKEFFTRNWLAKIVSIGLATALWISTAGDRPAESISKVVRVTPNIVGKPAPGHEIKEVMVSPQTVEIFGPEHELRVLESLPTEPVSIEGAYRDVQTSVDIQLAGPLVRMRHPAPAHVRIVILP